MVYNLPTRSSSAGATRYVLERTFGCPVMIIHTLSLPAADLAEYNVLILPEVSGHGGGYTQVLGERGISKLKDWIDQGGTLIALGSASHWLTEEKVGLLATKLEHKKVDSDKEETQPDPKVKESAAQDKQVSEAEEEMPESTPGAIMRVSLDNEHWLAFGYESNANVLVSSNRIFTPLKPKAGRNVGLYRAKEELLISGFTWTESRDQLANKAYLMHQSQGRGNVVAFAEDPNFRAYMDGLGLLFMNAVHFGPAH
jgi:hypothetical protein